MADGSTEMFTKALAQRVPLKLCAPVGGRECLFETRLVKAGARAEPCVWAQFIRGDGQALDFLINNSREVEGSLTLDGSKLGMCTRVLKRDRQYWLTGSVMIDAVLLDWPTKIRACQNRANGRMMISARTGVQAELFRTKGWTGTPGVYRDAAKLPAELWDLSEGGASFVCPFDKSVAAIGPDEPLLVSIAYFKTKLVLEARRVHTKTMSGAMRLGVRFVPGSGEIPGSVETFRRIVGEIEGRTNHRLFAGARAGLVASA